MNLTIENKLMLQQFFANRPVYKAYLFGSYARNGMDMNSDNDILVELDHSRPIGMKFFDYKAEHEDLLKIKMDLVSEEGFLKYVKPFINKDKILIYERAYSC